MTKFLGGFAQLAKREFKYIKYLLKFLDKKMIKK